MPSYDFKCPACGQVQTIVTQINAYNTTFLYCPNPDHPQTKLRRKYTPSAIIFKGSGWAGKQ